jgi:hypothetical protein
MRLTCVIYCAIGSAIGISLVTNLLNSREQLHQAYLGEI